MRANPFMFASGTLRDVCPFLERIGHFFVLTFLLSCTRARAYVEIGNKRPEVSATRTAAQDFCADEQEKNA